MKHPFQTVVALLGLAASQLALAGVLATEPAAAAAKPGLSPETDRLCSGSPVPCSVQVAPVRIEGSSGEVVVTGNSDVTVTVRAFRLVERGGGRRLTGYGPEIELTTDDNGFAVGDLVLPDVPDDESGGALLIALGDAADGANADLANILGTWTVLASRRPLVLGDGFGAEKPVGRPLQLAVTAATPGAAFDIELRRSGTWSSIATGTAQPCRDATGTCLIDYELPRGLEAETQQVRLVNLGSGLPVAEWEVLPSVDGEVAARSTLSTPPVGTTVPGTGTLGGGTSTVPRPRTQSLDVDVASEVAGASGARSHSQDVVRRAAGGLAVAALLAGLAAVVLGPRRPRAVRADRAVRPGSPEHP